MGEKDISEKILLACPDVAADIFNVFFGLSGTPFEIKPEELKETKESSFYKLD